MKIVRILTVPQFREQMPIKSDQLNALLDRAIVAGGIERVHGDPLYDALGEGIKEIFVFDDGIIIIHSDWEGLSEQDSAYLLWDGASWKYPADESAYQEHFDKLHGSL